VRHVYYIHGFAAAVPSNKSKRFGEAFAPAGVEVQAPDFNQPDFATLTATRMLTQLEADLATGPPGPVAIIGSSLGGFVAFHAAVRQARRRAAGEALSRPIDRLVLLAPAFEFGRSSYGTIDAGEIERWRATGWLEVFHWGDNAPRRVHFGLYEDAQQYDSLRERVPVPTLIFQGRSDAAVDPAMVERYASSQPRVALRMMDDDHLLMQNIDLIVRETGAFLGLPSA
jgi:hypothetical protein